MTIWIKLKVFAPYDKISNVGTKYQTIDGKRTLINSDGVNAFSIRKGRFLAIDFEWKDLDEAKKRFDPAVFEFFKSQSQALKACEKEKKLLKMLPWERLEAKRKRVRDKVDKSRYGQKRPTIDDVIKEAKRIGADMPSNP